VRSEKWQPVRLAHPDLWHEEMKKEVISLMDAAKENAGKVIFVRPALGRKEVCGCQMVYVDAEQTGQLRPDKLAVMSRLALCQIQAD
jgi:hypothetical protein